MVKEMIKWLLLIYFIVASSCFLKQEEMEKKINQCIISNTSDTYGRDILEVNQIDLATRFEILLLSNDLINDIGGQNYKALFESIRGKKIDTTVLAEILKKASSTNLDLLAYPTLVLTPMGCVNTMRDDHKEVFESIESLIALSESFKKYKKTTDLETLVISITDKVSEADFRAKILYRIPVITAMYGIMEQTYSRYRNPESRK